MLYTSTRDAVCSEERMFACGCWSWVVWVFAACFALSLVTYLITLMGCQCLRSKQNLKKKYDATWALVTGASSGIGLAIVRCVTGSVQFVLCS